MRRRLLLVFFLVLCVSSVAYAEEPETMVFGATAQGQFTATESTARYQLTLPSAGRVRLSLTAQLPWLTCALYDADMQRVWSSNPRRDSTAGEIACTQSIDLTAGMYTLVLTAEQENSGSYSVSATFAAAAETCPETGQGLLDAPELKPNTVCDGQLAVNDTADYYWLDIPASGRLDLSCSAEMLWLELALYDENENILWRSNPTWDSDTRRSSCALSMELVQGRYYLAVSGDTANTGGYRLRSTNTSAAETHPERQGALHNDISLADPLTSGVTRGHLAINDTLDYFRIQVPRGQTLALSGTAAISYLQVRLYDEAGDELWSTKKRWDAATRSLSWSKTLLLPKGTYYLAVIGGKEFTGAYTLRLKQTALTVPKLVKAAAKDYKTIQVTWKQTKNATGYILYRRAGTGAWKKRATISSPKTVTYTDTGLGCGTSYTYTLRAVYAGLTGSVTSEYNKTGVRATPKLNKPTLTVQSGTNAVALSWKKVPGAAGYEVYRSTKKSSGFRKLGTTKSLTYKDKTAKRGKKYYYRLRAYRKVSGKLRYSAYSSVLNGKRK